MNKNLLLLIYKELKQLRGISGKNLEIQRKLLQRKEAILNNVTITKPNRKIKIKKSIPNQQSNLNFDKITIEIG